MQTEEYGKLFEHEDSYWWFVSRRQLALRLMEIAQKEAPAGPVLDMGCGTGAVLQAMPESYGAVGVDMSPLALDFCHRRGLRRLVLGDGEALPFADNSFSGIIALDIFEHIADDRRAFAEAYRVLKPGGSLVLSVPAYQWLWGPHDVALMHHRRYRSKEVSARLLEAGLTVSHISASVFLLFPAVVATRTLDRLSRRPPKVSLPVLSSWLNDELVKVQSLECQWISHGRKLPWGSSVVAVARKGQELL